MEHKIAAQLVAPFPQTEIRQNNTPILAPFQDVPIRHSNRRLSRCETENRPRDRDSCFLLTVGSGWKKTKQPQGRNVVVILEHTDESLRSANNWEQLNGSLLSRQRRRLLKHSQFVLEGEEEAAAPDDDESENQPGPGGGDLLQDPPLLGHSSCLRVHCLIQKYFSEQIG